MASKLVTVRYTGPFDEVVVEQDGVDRVFVRGAEERVPADLAGRAPVPAASEDETDDPGEGLLAQTDNWQVVAKPTASTKE